MRLPNLRRQGFVPMFQGTRVWIGREGVSEETPAGASRSTAPHRPSGRQLDGLPSGGARTSMGVVLNADHSAARKSEKRLISLGSISRMPGIEAPQSPYFLRQDPVIPRFMRGTHLSAAGAKRKNALTRKLNPGSRA